MGNRSRLVYRAECQVGQQETLNLDETLPFNATLLQFSIALGGSVLAGDFLIRKISVSGARYDLDIFREDLSVGAILYTLSCCDIEFMLGDQVTAQFANPDDEDVGLELIFKEGE